MHKWHQSRPSWRNPLPLFDEWTPGGWWDFEKKLSETKIKCMEYEMELSRWWFQPMWKYIIFFQLGCFNHHQLVIHDKNFECCQNLAVTVVQSSNLYLVWNIYIPQKWNCLGGGFNPMWKIYHFFNPFFGYKNKRPLKTTTSRWFNSWPFHPLLEVTTTP